MSDAATIKGKVAPETRRSMLRVERTIERVLERRRGTLFGDYQRNEQITHRFVLRGELPVVCSPDHVQISTEIILFGAALGMPVISLWTFARSFSWTVSKQVNAHDPLGPSLSTRFSRRGLSLYRDSPLIIPGVFRLVLLAVSDAVFQLSLFGAEREITHWYSKAPARAAISLASR